MLTYLAFRSLYRRSLKLALDWAVHRHLWRGQALYIRSLFEANRNVTDPRHQRVRRQLAVGGRLQADNGIQALLSETEKLLESWKHPDPYTPPTAPGGMLVHWPTTALRKLLTTTHRLKVRAKPAIAYPRP